MGLKRGSILSLFTLAISIFALFVLAAENVSAQTGKECSVNINSECSGRTIQMTGFGAVELCQVCYKCGVSDGVCPESFSDGVYEPANSMKTNVTMRVRRPTFETDKYTVAYDTGNDACESIGGVCDYVLRSTNNIAWALVPGGCIVDVSEADQTYNAYYRAVCKEVPRKAGCQYCPDPDCVNDLNGYAVENTAEAGPLSGVHIDVTSNNNDNIDVWPHGNSANGVYSMKAIMGEVNITCTKEGYTTYSKIQYLGPGNNIFDCIMDRADGSCTPTCYTQNPLGETICDASCNGINGCVMTEQARTMCDEKYLGSMFAIDTEEVISPWNGCVYSNISFLHCCNGAISSQLLRILGPGGCNCDYYQADCVPIGTGGPMIESNATDLITRSFRKVLNGKPVEIKIIVYNKQPLTMKSREE